MELWVRTQDRKCLTQVSHLYIDDNNHIRQDNDLILGTYNTKRALEILDEIQNILHPNIIFKPFTHIDNNPKFTYVHTISESGEMQFQELSTYVYEMPKG